MSNFLYVAISDRIELKTMSGNGREDLLWSFESSTILFWWFFFLLLLLGNQMNRINSLAPSPSNWWISSHRHFIYRFFFLQGDSCSSSMERKIPSCLLKNSFSFVVCRQNRSICVSFTKFYLIIDKNLVNRRFSWHRLNLIWLIEIESINRSDLQLSSNYLPLHCSHHSETLSNFFLISVQTFFFVLSRKVKNFNRLRRSKSISSSFS